jgi:glycosyltransferase involved in cell wall biosynthesis
VKQELPYDLTVITVCRNALELLPRCIASVQPLYHSALRVEHLLIDGASTDGTAEYLANALRCGLITRFVSEPDRGIYDAMNKGICLARGRVLVFINADDEIVAGVVPDCCAPLLSGMAGYTVASAWCLEGERRKLLRPRMDRVLWRQPYCHQAMYCTRELLLRFDGFAGESFPIGADTDLMRRLYVARVPYEIVPVVAARFYSGGASSAPETSRDVYELMLKFAEACSEEVRRRPAMSAMVMKHLRRYVNKRVQLAPQDDWYAAEAARLAAFVRQVVQGLNPVQRFVLAHRLRLQGCWYALRTRCTSGKRREYTRLNQEICTLFAENI